MAKQFRIASTSVYPCPMDMESDDFAVLFTFAWLRASHELERDIDADDPIVNCRHWYSITNQWTYKTTLFFSAELSGLMPYRLSGEYILHWDNNVGDWAWTPSALETIATELECSVDDLTRTNISDALRSAVENDIIGC